MAGVPPVTSSTKETTNYARLCRLLVDVGSQALRDTFNCIHAPGSLHTVLANPPAQTILQSLYKPKKGKKKILNPIQWGKLYPAIPTSVNSAHFDITLLMILLRNICSLSPPATGWDALPPAADTSTEADITRVKYFRNVVYGHAEQASVDDKSFNNHWHDIKAALVRLGGTSYGDAIDDLQNDCMDPGVEEHYKELLQQWKRDEDGIQDQLNEISGDVKYLIKILGDLTEIVSPKKEVIVEESNGGKTGEIFQQGDVHRKARSRDTEDSVAVSYRDRKETVLEFEVEDIPSTSDFMKEVRREKNYLPKSKAFKDLCKAQKQEDSKDLKELREKVEKLISKVTDTINSLRTAANKLDEVWKESKKTHAAGGAGSIVGGLLAIAGGIASAMTLGATTPLLIAGMGIGAAGAGANVVTSLKEDSINFSEMKKVEKKFKDIGDSMKHVHDTIQLWSETKEKERLLYICCLVELNPDKNDPVKKLLQNLVLHAVRFSGVTSFSRKIERAGAYCIVNTPPSPRQAEIMAQNAGESVLWNIITLSCTIKDIVEDKGSESARGLRQMADELEMLFYEMS